MKVVFLVQGEGRGHLTQAISLSQILQDAGHQVAAVLVGKAEGREVPGFFSAQIRASVYTFSSPDLLYNTSKGSICLSKSIYRHLLRTRRYCGSLRAIHAHITQIKPDLIVNFYEVLGGLYTLRYRPSAPVVCIAHQYLLLHPRFPFPRNRRFSRMMLNVYTRLTALGARQKLALSFRRYGSEGLSANLTVVPPLLRQTVKQLVPGSGDFVLVYLTHASLSKHIVAWHKHHPEVSLHCFRDDPTAPQTERVDATLVFHQLSGTGYLHMMQDCRALVSTAGFESICEAMYLGKPVLMVPVSNHFEQTCNAIDGVLAGAGVTSQLFDVSVLINYLPDFQSPQAAFQAWCNESTSIFLRHLENCCLPPT